MSRRLLLALPVVFGVGCTALPQPLKTYAGPELPAHAVAQIAGEPGPRGDVFVACMDGASLDRYVGGYDNNSRWPDKLAVIPGRHYLAVVYSLRLGQKAWWANVELDANPGRRYLIKGNEDGASVAMWVVDESAPAAVVARAVPRTAVRSKPDPCP